MRRSRTALLVAASACLLGVLGAASADPLPGLGVDPQCFAPTTRIDPMPGPGG